MTVTVNGDVRHVAADATVASLVAELTAASSGIAVAVNETIVPQEAWETTTLGEGDRVEVLTAVQGG